MAAVTRTGTLRGEILPWDVRAPRRITTLKGPTITVPFSTETVTASLAFDADGSSLAVQNSDGQLRVWDVDRGKPRVLNALCSASDTLVGFGPAGSTVTYLFGKKQVQIYDQAGDGASETLAVAGDDWTAGFVNGHRLTIETGQLRQTFDLRSDAQFRALCAGAGRDYTKAERKLLPEGARSEPPCA
ncbi:hypothetical protein ACWD5R_28480 [Streptomyces sp. NPDC002514]|uniref:hypothetical protein n=1 Tax=Streptomyces sp. NPDC001270 TaxID=3364554 RepID=UPI0036A8DC62